MAKINEIEELLRDSKLSIKNTAQFRYNTWQRILRAQRERRTSKSLVKIPAWIWPMASILVVLLCFIYFFLMK